MRGRIRMLLLVGSVAAAGVGLAAAAPSPVHPLPHPLPEPAFLQPVPAGECTVTNEYETKLWNQGIYEGYGDKCKRLHFVFGPIIAKPGQNDVLIEPVTIQKPAYDGYIVRFRPDLVDATGKPPSIEEIHLHHGTWLNVIPQYGSGPFFAAGEEKTIATFPPGYGMKVGAADTWLLLYMVHNAIQTPRPVWITYDVDFIAEKDAEALDIKPVVPVWLDVQRQPVYEGATDTGGNPVFNVQKGFGATDTSLFGDASIGPGSGLEVCAWPKQNCARHDVYGNVTPQQGVDVSAKPDAPLGADWKVPKEFAGTLIGIGGHLHPGGIRDEVSLVRDGVEKPIFFSEAVPWEHQDVNEDGKIDAGKYEELDSWDFSMTVTGSTLGWKVKIEEGDVIRLNAIYDTQYSSWYENMGIVVALLSPEASESEIESNPDSLAYHGGPAIDVFDGDVILDAGLPVLGTEAPGWPTPSCTPDPVSATKRLCLRGQVTHGHMEEASHHGGGSEVPLPTTVTDGFVDQLVSVGFTFGQADLGVAGSMGIPKLKLGEKATFWNLDSPIDIWHTWTRCKEPCTGSTGISYPLANGSTGMDDSMDFDSTEIGYGLFFSPASGQLGGSIGQYSGFGGENKSTGEALRDGLYWEFTPMQTGTYSLFCRIHPFMRGVFTVAE